MSDQSSPEIDAVTRMLIEQLQMEDAKQLASQTKKSDAVQKEEEKVSFFSVVPDVDIEEKRNFQQTLDFFRGKPAFITKFCDQPMVGTGEAKLVQKPDGSKFIVVEVEYYGPYGDSEYGKYSQTEVVPFFSGPVRLKDLSVRPVVKSDLEQLELLRNRGTKFLEYTQKPTYLHGSGFLYVPNPMGGMSRIDLDGRVVVDATGYRKFSNANRYYADNQDLQKTITDDSVVMTVPTVPAYSLEHKRWGDVPVVQLGPIDFDETAFSRTILPEDYKLLLKKIAFNYKKNKCADFVGKHKKGVVLALFGLPGSGKSLSIKGLAELTKSPIYSVGASDIGTNAPQIDQSLNKIFNLVSRWDGFVLIDEADAFMERRERKNIQQTACASAFLTRIEQFEGILFLASNRMHTIDPAFDSRIHIRLFFSNLNKEGRTKVWKGAFERQQIEALTNEEFAKLGDHKFNNREITNMVEIAKITAEDPTKVTYDAVELLINMRRDFDDKKRTIPDWEEDQDAVEEMKLD